MERLQNIAISVFKTALNHVFINRGFVGVGHGGDIVGAFRAAFDFEAGGTGVNQIIQVPQHIHVLRIEQIGAVLGLLDREVLAGALLFHDRILPAAWLGAFAVIAIAAGQIVGEQAAAGEGHAHSTVDEAFDVEVIGNVGANITHGLQVHLAGQHHTASTKLVEGVRSLIISHAGLGGDVQFQIRSHLTGHHHHANIGDDQRVHAGVFELADVFAHRFDFIVARQHIAGHIHASATLMRVTGAFFEILQTQVFRRRTHAERLTSAVDGVRTVIDGGFQSSQIARGSQYFRLVSSLHACSSYSIFPLYILDYSRDTSAASGKYIRGKTHAEKQRRPSWRRTP